MFCAHVQKKDYRGYKVKRIPCTLQKYFAIRIGAVYELKPVKMANFQTESIRTASLLTKKISMLQKILC